MPKTRERLERCDVRQNLFLWYLVISAFVAFRNRHSQWPETSVYNKNAHSWCITQLVIPSTVPHIRKQVSLLKCFSWRNETLVFAISRHLHLCFTGAWTTIAPGASIVSSAKFLEKFLITPVPFNWAKRNAFAVEAHHHQQRAIHKVLRNVVCDDGPLWKGRVDGSQRYKLWRTRLYRNNEWLFPVGRASHIGGRYTRVAQRISHYNVAQSMTDKGEQMTFAQRALAKTNRVLYQSAENAFRR